MLIKKITIFLKNGNKEDIACFEYTKSVVQNKEVYAFKTNTNQIYTVPLELINLDLKFIIKYIWSFPPREGPFQKRYDNR